MGGKKPTRIFEYKDRESEFGEVKQKLPLHEVLDSDKILLFVDPTRDRVWIWRGSNTNTRMKFLARRLVSSIRDRYEIGFKKIPNYINASPKMKLLVAMSVTSIIDEGNEPFDFKLMIGLVEESDYPEFKVNDLLTLKIEDNKTFIYIKGKKFIQCMRLFLQIPPQKSNLYEEIESIDEATEIFDKFLLENRIVEGKFQKPVIDFNNTITPEQEFWGHCSNIQAWVECGYDTRLLHSNLSFPLLKALSDTGDQLALLRFKEEIALRLEGGYFPVILYLIKENYLRYLPPDYLRDLRIKISGAFIPEIFKVLKRGYFGSYMINLKRTELRQRSNEEYSRLRRLQDLLYVPHIVNQMNPKDFVIGLAVLDFTFLDFFINPNIENKESYLEDLLERFIEGLNSKDSLFHKASEHFIERIIHYLFGSIKKIMSYKLIGEEVHRLNKISIIWLLERIYENGGEDVIINTMNNFFRGVDQNYLSQLELVEDAVSFRIFLESLVEKYQNI